MEWTDAARTELTRVLRELHASLNPVDVDPEEVIADIRDRMESELNAQGRSPVTAEQVRAAAGQLGVHELIRSAPEEDPLREQFDQGMQRPRRWRNRVVTGWFWFTGIILPLITLGVEGLTHICLDTGLPDPLPTPFHAIMILLVPVACYLGWQHLHDRKTLPLKWLGLLVGAATMVAMFYTLMFITITPFALLGFAAIIYFGIGLICFLPLSPLLSLFALVYLFRRLKGVLQARIPHYGHGMLLGLAALLLASGPMYLTRLGLQMAASDHPETQVRGIRLLRSFGDPVLMNRACYRNINMPATDPISWLINRGLPVSPDQVRDIYYRVTGAAFNTEMSPTLGIRTRRNPGNEFDWDPEQGGDAVAGRLKGLSLQASRMDGLIHADAATAYMEWTLVFRNDWHREREARAQIELPPGAVVSRLTLWIDGEEREAAFGGRSQVKQAYKNVVQVQRRDPLMVTTYGPDRVLMQCYPVPADGEMKIRIGITAPLDCLTGTERVLRLPHFLERNFRMPADVQHAVWFENHLVDDLTDAELNAPGARISTPASTSTCWAEQDGLTVLQEICPSTRNKPHELALVVDTSVGMKDSFESISAALDALPEGLPVSIWLNGDPGPASVEPGALNSCRAAGGQDSAPALRQALTGPADTVVWIHAAQGWDMGSSEILRQAMERSPGKQLYDVQVDHGPNRLIEKMDNLRGFHRVARYGSVQEDLESLFQSFSPAHVEWEAARMSVGSGDESVYRTDDHLIRLYVLDQIKSALSDQDPDNSAALQLALKHHLVTPVSGAVVLENQQQYDEADLQPVDSSIVPSVPEPGSLILLLLAGVWVVYGKRMLRHIRGLLGGAA